MKEIKFRAWIDDSKTLEFIERIDFLSKLVLFCGKSTWNDYEYEDITIEQYTGLKDKNNIDIYEGDIVKNTYGKLEKVVFVNGSFQCASIKHPSLNLYLLDTYSNHIEVVGNIHEENENDK